MKQQLLKRFALAIAILVAFVSYAQQQEGDKAIVDYRSSKMKVIKDGDSTIMKLIGDVVFFHNGAIITCDSAYRYSESRMDGMGRVVINQDSLYIYGDKVTYNGQSNIAQVFAPIIKTVDGDATLYTRNMSFNTQTKVGQYSGGGTMTQHDNLMESSKGVYYSQSRTVDFIGSVAMRNSNYVISTDSIGYDMNSQVVTFYSPTDIWNHQGEFLSADEGNYDRVKQIYNFTKNSYILTKDQELWSEKLTYYSTKSEAELFTDIQMLDTTQGVISFGDRGHYWGKERRVILTEDPSTLAYDSQTGDTLYTRADTLLVFPALSLINQDSLNASANIAAEKIESDSLSVLQDSTAMAVADSLAATPLVASDSVATNLIASDSIAHKEILADTVEITPEILADTTILTPRQRKRVERATRRKARQKARVEKFLERDGAHGIAIMEEGHDHNHDHEHDHDHDHEHDHSADSTVAEQPLVDVISQSRAQADSSDYIINGFNNVKIFRLDMQAVCDSLVMISTDSTMHMFKEPVLWNQTNQITAGKITVFSKAGVIHRAELDDFPILSQAVDTTKSWYNQVRGKFMEGFFNNNALTQLDVNGNSEAIYYRGENGIVDGIMNTASANMELYFEQNQITIMKWFNSIDTGTYPLDRMTGEVKTKLEDFEWLAYRRPKSKEEIFNRLIRASQRLEKESIPKPLFDITSGIDYQKQVLIEAGEWSDRNELITIDKQTLENSDL